MSYACPSAAGFVKGSDLKSKYMLHPCSTTHAWRIVQMNTTGAGFLYLFAQAVQAVVAHVLP